jgi:TonB family protein
VTLGALALACGLAFAQDAPKVAGTDVPAPKRTKLVLPEYPPEAAAKGLRGIVVLEIVIDPQGKVAYVEVIRSVPPFDAAAITAVKKWEYEVTRVDGRPVSVRLTVPITFALPVPEVSRLEGIPALRVGATPAVPRETRAPVKVTAEVTLDAEGDVAEARILEGSAPWADALLQALRTWRFVADGGEGVVSFRVEAEFRPGDGGETPRVALRLDGLRRSVASAEPPPEPAAAQPAPAAPAETSEAPPEEGPAPPAAPQPSAPPQPAPPPAPPSPEPGATEQEVLAAPPRPAPEAGASAVRDVTLSAGVPDLVKGRRPVVPPLARMAEAEGIVRVRFAVDAAGATSVQGAEGPELLKPAAEHAVASWVFRRSSPERLYLLAEFSYSGDAAAAAVRPQE